MSKYFTSIRDYIPNVFKAKDSNNIDKGRDKSSNTSSSKNKVSIKKSNEEFYSDFELNQLLTSKIEIEIITGLKYIIIKLMQLNKDASKFAFQVIQLLSHNSLYIRKLSFHIIENLCQEEKEIFTLLFNTIDLKLKKDSDLLSKYYCLQLLQRLKNQSTIKTQCFSKILKSVDEQNPILRKIAIMSIAKYLNSETEIKINNSDSDSNSNSISISNKCLIEEQELEDLVIKLLNENNIELVGATLNFLVETNNKDYFNFKIPLFFDKVLNMLEEFNDSDFEKAVFYLVNFTVYFLVSKKENFVFVEKLLLKLLEISCCCNESIEIISLFSIKAVLKAFSYFDTKSLLSDFLIKNDFSYTKKLVNVLFRNSSNCTGISSSFVFNYGKINYQNHLFSKEYSIIKRDSVYPQIGNSSLIYKMMYLNLILEYIDSFTKVFSSNSNSKTIESNNDTDDNSDINFQSIIALLSSTNNLNALKLNIDDDEIITTMKLQITCLLINEKNFKQIVDSYSQLLSLPIKIKTKILIIQSLYILTKKNSLAIKALVIKKLIELINNENQLISNEVLFIIRKLSFEVVEYRDILIVNLISFDLNSLATEAKCSIIWLLSRFISNKPTLILSYYKKLIMRLDIEEEAYKEQLILFSLKFLIAVYDDSNKVILNEKNISALLSLIGFTLKKLLLDESYLIREKAREITILRDILLCIFDNNNENYESNALSKNKNIIINELKSLYRGSNDKNINDIDIKSNKKDYSLISETKSILLIISSLDRQEKEISKILINSSNEDNSDVSNKYNITILNNAYGGKYIKLSELKQNLTIQDLLISERAENNSNRGKSIINSIYLKKLVSHIAYEHDNIENFDNEEVRNFTMTRFIEHFNIENKETKTNINNNTDRYTNIDSNKKTNINSNIQNFSHQFDLKDSQLDDYKKKLEMEMNKLLKSNEQDNEDEDDDGEEAEIKYD